jgi:hypothetical protein
LGCSIILNKITIHFSVILLIPSSEKITEGIVSSENTSPYDFKSIYFTLESLTLKPYKTVSQTACEFLEQKYLLFCLFPLIFKAPGHTTTVPQYKTNKQVPDQ